jgi:hypothetical protein
MPDEFPPSVAAVPPPITGPNLKTPSEPVRQRVRVTEASCGVPLPPIAPREATANVETTNGGGGSEDPGEMSLDDTVDLELCDGRTLRVVGKIVS